MADEPQPESTPPGDRRQQDRRRLDRRAPLPFWRRPWALVAYGVLATLFVVLLLNRSRPQPIPLGQDEVVMTGPAARSAAQSSGQRRAEPPVEARGMVDYERLMAEGASARGRQLRVELYCSSVNQVALRGVDVVEAAVAELADASNRVPAAECKWGPRVGDEPRADLLLLVPQEMVEAFAAAPVVDDGFVPRRRLLAVVEWVGRSDALALRTVGVLREYNVTQGA